MLPGSFRLKPKTAIVVNASTARLGTMLQSYLAPPTGLPLSIVAKPQVQSISLRIDASAKALGQEGYRLSVNPNSVSIVGGGEAGVFYGIQTLRQLLPTSVFRKGLVAKQDWTIPCLDIADAPRFSWRGAHLDTSRHFILKKDVLDYLDSLALHKLNTLHFHLTDDQGWRMQVRKYPRLTTVGAWHKANKLTNDPTTWDTMPDGGFYSQDDLREIVAYAKDRFINVVPEIEMPGHAMGAIVAYPELGNTGKQFELKGINEGTEDVVNVSPATVKFFEHVLTEVMEIFPSKFIHIGGDEVWKDPWHNNPQMQAQMKQFALKDENELQSWFIHQIDNFLTTHGRRMVGWDEILQGGLAPGATVMSWTGIDNGIVAAKAGHDVVMAPTSHTYLDYYQSSDRSNEPQAIGGLVTLEKTYSFDPVPANLDSTASKHILGAQGQLWTEYMPNIDHVNYMAFPRLCALAEVVWSPAKGKDYADFLQRLPTHLQRLQAAGINYRPLDKPEAPPIGGWKSGELPEAFTVKEWEVSVPDTGKYVTRFQYLQGGCRLDIEWAELVCDGEVVSRDGHAGRTGSIDSENTYRFNVSTRKPGSKYFLRASIKPDGGTDSEGEIRFRKD